jgi:putative phosphoribosyl transferase
MNIASFTISPFADVGASDDCSPDQSGTRSQSPPAASSSKIAVRIRDGATVFSGDLELPPGARGVVVFAHGAGSSRHSPRNQYVAGVLRHAGIGTLLLDLEPPRDEKSGTAGRGGGSVESYAGRLALATRWLEDFPATRGLKTAYFGSSSGGAAALLAAAELGDRVAAVVCRGGRLDSVTKALPLVEAPTLLIAGGHDTLIVCVNDDALSRLRCEKQLRLVRGATHLFEEPEALGKVAELATGWFATHLPTPAAVAMPLWQFFPS